MHPFVEIIGTIINISKVKEGNTCTTLILKIDGGSNLLFYPTQSEIITFVSQPMLVI
ncbi:hypothetical protein THPR109532_07075 [Thalassospira profundimaris]